VYELKFMVAVDRSGDRPLRVMRVLEPDQPTRLTRGHVTAGWCLPGGEETRGLLVTLRDAAP
jgi:hypothetical protein